MLMQIKSLKILLSGITVYAHLDFEKEVHFSFFFFIVTLRFETFTNKIGLRVSFLRRVVGKSDHSQGIVKSIFTKKYVVWYSNFAEKDVYFYNIF